MSASEEEFIPEEEAQNPGAALKKLREKLATAVKEKQEYLEGWQRSRADFINFKREESERERELKLRAQTELAEALIPALDSFEMALRDQGLQSADPNWQKGIRSAYESLARALEGIGIIRYTPEGERFDTQLHEALRELPTSDPALDHVVESVLRAGYRIGDRVIRPAQVSVYIHQT